MNPAADAPDQSLSLITPSRDGPDAAGRRLPPEPRQPRWHYLYYVLAVFDLCTVLISLTLNHRIVHIYVDSVEGNQAWVELLLGFSDLDQLATTLNAPGNDVFETGLVQAERQKLHQAQQQFGQKAAVLHDAIRRQAETSAVPLLESLQQVRTSADRMTADAERIFTALEKNDRQEAGRHMATMDRQYARIQSNLDQLRRQVSERQQEQFDRETRAAASVQRFEYLLGGLMLVMVAGATFYGRQLAHQAAASQREREIARARQQEAANRARLLQQVLAAQEDERRRIARDLHDEIGQTLTSLLIGLRNLDGAPDPETARQRIADLRGGVGTALDEVRRLARGLRPAALDDLGLIAALERFVADFSQAHGLQARIQAPNFGCQRLPEGIETALYRIAQEALTNAAKHGQARNVRLLVSRRPAEVEMTVEDDGQGFSLEAQRRAQRSGRHLGISGMRERAALLGGRMEIDSWPGHGSRLHVRIPLEGRDEQDSRADCR